MKNKNRQKPVGLKARLHFDEERTHGWLGFLLDAYAIVDTGVELAVRREERLRKDKVACSKGCDACCRQSDIPLYPHELVGIYWYVSEKLAEPLREILLQRVKRGMKEDECPFLIDRACSIHPMRPVSCRQFNVFGSPCKEGEDPYYSRLGDVLMPLNEYVDRAFGTVLPLYNIKPGSGMEGSVRLVRSQVMNLRTFDWSKLAAVMDRAKAAAKNADIG